MFTVSCLIPKILSVLGSDVVDWLYSHVEGFQDRREARKYACNLLKVNGVIYQYLCSVNSVHYHVECWLTMCN